MIWEFEDALERVYEAGASEDLNRIMEAQQAFHDRYRDTPESYALRFYHTLGTKELSEAQEFASKIPTNLLEEPVIVACLARLRAFEGDTGEARALALTAFDEGPDHRMVLSYTTQTLTHVGYLTDALKIATHWSELRPNDPMSHHFVAELAWRLHSKELLDHYIHFPPECFATAHHYALFRWAVSNSAKDLATAEKMARLAISRAPSCSRAYLALAGTLSQLERFEEAEQAAHKALEFNPKSGAPWQILSSIALTKGDKDAAQRLLPMTSHAIASHQEASEIVEALQLPLGLKAEALQEIEESAPNQLVRLRLAAARLRKLITKKDTVGISVLLESLDVEDPDGETTYLAKWALAHLGNAHDHAMRVIREALERYPGSPEFAGRRLQTLAALERYEELEFSLQALIQTPPNAPSSCVHIYSVMLTIGRPQHAERFVQSALQKFPQSQMLRNSRERVFKLREKREAEKLAKMKPLKRMLYLAKKRFRELFF